MPWITQAENGFRNFGCIIRNTRNNKGLVKKTCIGIAVGTIRGSDNETGIATESHDLGFEDHPKDCDPEPAA